MPPDIPADFVTADLDGNAAAARTLAVEATERLGGRIDLLVNNAGIYPPSTTMTIDEEAFDKIMGVNVRASFFPTQAVVAQMLAAGTA